MLHALLSVFILALIAPFIYRQSSVKVPVFLAVCTAGIMGYFLSYMADVAKGLTHTFQYPWADGLGVSLSFYVDGLSLFFALLISFFGVLIILYAGYYMKGMEHANRFFGYLILFMGSMLGLVLSGNIISMFVFWELTSISSYFLIGFKNKDEKSREAARQSILVTGGGGLVLLAGLVLMGIAGGSYNIPELLANTEVIRQHPYLSATIILILIGAFTKSAQFPFHFWLPNAMQAPTPVSAYLHSATMVKAGVFLVFRFNPIFTGIDQWQIILASVGGFTMVMGAIVAFKADDLKRILAFTTISALGIFFMMIGIGSEMALKAAMVYVLAHALYKGALFLAAGTLDHECGTRKISELSGIRKKMPWTASATILSCLSMMGIIPFLGFTGKELLYDAALYSGAPYFVLIVALVIASVFFAAVAIKIVYQTFFVKTENTGTTVPEASGFMFIPPLVLGVLGFLFGILPNLSVQPLLEVAAGNMGNTYGDLDMSLWHGLNTVLLLSLATIVLGIVLYSGRNTFEKIYRKLPFQLSAIPEKLYNESLATLTSFSLFQTRAVQNGYLRNYISMFIAVFCSLSIYYLFSSGFIFRPSIDFKWDDIRIYEILVLILVAITVVFLFFAKSRLTVIASIGIIGYGIALSYTFFSAPDVAITQFLAETLGLILLAVILPKLPRLHVSNQGSKIKYFLVSLTFGVLMVVITLIVMSAPVNDGLKEYFVENSLPLGKGENIVNVILVDFRAMDTLGEISVLVITMIGIISLLKLKPEKLEL